MSPRGAGPRVGSGSGMPRPDAAALARLDALADDLAAAGVAFERGQMFGCPGLRAPGRGKFFATLWGDDLVVKVEGGAREQALALDGARLFEPMPGRPMRQWVLLPVRHHERWTHLATAAAAGLGLA